MVYEYTRKSVRLSEILRVLKNNNIINKEYLAEELGVSTRTIVRDIKELINIGYKIKIINGRCGGYSLNIED